MEKIINLTRYPVTEEQKAEGAVEAEAREKVLELLTFQIAPGVMRITGVALALASIAYSEGAKKAAIGGPAFLTSALEAALIANGIVPVYPYYKTAEVTKTQKDGSTVRGVVALHIAYVESVRTQEKRKREELDKRWDKV